MLHSSKESVVSPKRNMIKPMPIPSSKEYNFQYESSHDQLCIMLQQDNSPAYTIHDYLSHIEAERTGLAYEDDDVVDCIMSDNSDLPIDHECRVKMAQWCFQVIDYAKYKRSTVSVAISLLDRFLSSHLTSPTANEAIHCRKVYQLASMTTLFMAIKVNERSDINGSTFCQLSRNIYDIEDILSMERAILDTLQWRINAPLALDFVKYFVTLVPCLRRQQKILKLQRRKRSNDLIERSSSSYHVDNGSFSTSSSSFADILDLCGYQIDLGVGQYSLISSKQSTIAVAALLNAFESNITSNMSFSMGNGKRFNHIDFINILTKELCVITNINVYSGEIEATKHELSRLLRASNCGNMKFKQGRVKSGIITSLSSSSTSSLSSSNTSITQNTNPIKARTGTNIRQSTYIRQASPICVSSARVLRRDSQSGSLDSTSSSSSRSVVETTKRSFLDRTSSFLQQRLGRSFT